MTFEKIGENQSASLLFIQMWSQDAITLFGFISEDERDMFRLLISVSGVGPKTAIALLSGIRVDELRNAIELEKHILYCSYGRKKLLKDSFWN